MSQTPTVKQATTEVIHEFTRINMSLESLPEKIADMNSVYFLRNKSDPIPIAANAVDASTIMPVYIEIGYLSGHVLLMLEQVLSEIYLPLLSNSSLDKVEEKDRELGKHSSLKADLVVSIQKFATQVSNFSQQVTGGNRLNIPQELYSLKNTDIDEASKNSQITKKLEGLAEEWIEAVSNCLILETKKEPAGNVSVLDLLRFRGLLQKSIFGEIVIHHSLLFMNN